MFNEMLTKTLQKFLGHIILYSGLPVNFIHMWYSGYLLTPEQNNPII